MIINLKSKILSALFIVIMTGLYAQENPPLQYPFGEPDSTPRGIFGEDGRKEIKDTEGFDEFARATAVLIPKDAIEGNRIYGYALRDVLTQKFESEAFDDNVKFLDQPTAASCTGFLISPDMLVTAGHCITTLEEAAEWVWLFDYTNDLKHNKKDGGYIEVNPANLYEIADVLVSEFEKGGDNSLDYAVLKLDRKSDRRPYRFRSSGVVAEGSNIYTIGAPSGLPLKLSTESTVVDNTAEAWFKSNIDSFPGSSGGPVFDSNGFIEGILVRGAVEYSSGSYADDYIYDEECDCIKTVTFTEVTDTSGCQAHKITDLPQILMNQSIYNNLEYAIQNKFTDRFNDWATYSWIFASDYTKNRGRLEEIAIKAENYQVVEQLISKNSEKYEDDYVRTLFDIAIDTDNKRLLDLLLSNELDPDAGYNAPYKLIQESVKNNDVFTTRQLLEAGAQLEVKDDKGNSLLHYTASNGNAELTNILLAQKISTDIKNNAGSYPEKVAEKAGHRELAKLLKNARKKK